MVASPLSGTFLVTRDRGGESSAGIKGSNAGLGRRDRESIEKNIAEQREKAYKQGFSEGLVYQKNQLV